MDDFLIRACLAGFGLALAAGPLGCFVVWRRMAYFGDATAHAAILGVAMALAFEISINIGVFMIALVMAVSVAGLSERRFGADTLLGVLAHSALAFGLIAVALIGVRVDLMVYLFGDILAVSRTDLAVIWGGAAIIVGLLVWRWRAMITMTLSPDLAHAAGISPRQEKLILMLALALLVALALKIIGALLITSMLIIPAATARSLSRTPEQMAIIAVLLASIAVVAGLWAAFQLDTPAGPTIVATASVMFFVSSLRRLKP